MRRLVALLAATAALGSAAPAAADVVTAQDAAGRTITFDVRAEGVDVEWYAELLRTAAHGNEIEHVTVRVVSPAELRRTCGAAAGGCYSGSRFAARIVVPTGQSPRTAHTLLHEYAHHVDAWRGVAAAAREPNGSASWWNARAIDRLLAAGKASHTYSLGWERAIGEIFAEDYTQLHLETRYGISWLAPPTTAIRAALRRDLENAPAAPAPAAAKPPVVIPRTGILRPGRTVSIPFELIGPGRRVTYKATITRGAAAVVEIGCSDGRRARRTLRGDLRTTTIDLKDLGPARCAAALRGTGTRVGGFSLRVRLAVERAAT
ncbi:MAG TPA: hypothetical protein VNT58_08300 [Gaiellaceae bacterium]|nr:hypothetical protein [Gaiellaceae bacterium]